jgi:ferredoxin
MSIEINKDECTGCGSCVDQCHIGAIRLINDTADVDPDECAECGMCVDVCPNGALTLP